MGAQLLGCDGPGLEPPTSDPSSGLSGGATAGAGAPVLPEPGGPLMPGAGAAGTAPVGGMAMNPMMPAGESGAGGMSGGHAGPGTGAEPPATDCVEATWPVEGVGLHLVIDESLAMVFPRDLWTPLGSALDTFIATQATGDLSIGLQFFAGECDEAAYATPELPIAPAGERLDALAQTMSGRDHGRGAATALALTGAIDYARAWSTEHARRAAVVLISGSEPSGCLADAQAAADAAAAGLAGVPALRTYVLALRPQAGLDRVAQAGGTGTALAVEDPSSGAAIASALERIANRAACEIALPESAAPYLPDRLAVRLTQATGAAFVPRVESAADCAAAGNGFHYDDPQAPVRVVLCPQTCTAAAGGTVELVFGCATPIP